MMLQAADAIGHLVDALFQVKIQKEHLTNERDPPIYIRYSQLIAISWGA
jgi:hypothetical protein